MSSALHETGTYLQCSRNVLFLCWHLRVFTASRLTETAPGRGAGMFPAAQSDGTRSWMDVPDAAVDAAAAHRSVRQRCAADAHREGSRRGNHSVEEDTGCSELGHDEGSGEKAQGQRRTGQVNVFPS